MSDTSRENIHATGVVLDGRGLLLRGPPGAGKSLLGLALLDDFAARGKPALLVSDDRVDLVVAADELVMQTPKTIAGLIELRGRGIVKRPFVAEAPLDLVIDLVDRLERMVEEDELATTLLGVELARAPVPKAGIVDVRHQILLINEALAALRPVPAEGQKARQKTT